MAGRRLCTAAASHACRASRVRCVARSEGTQGTTCGFAEHVHVARCGVGSVVGAVRWRGVHVAATNQSARQRCSNQTAREEHMKWKPRKWCGSWRLGRTLWTRSETGPCCLSCARRLFGTAGPCLGKPAARAWTLYCRVHAVRAARGGSAAVSLQGVVPRRLVEGSHASSRHAHHRAWRGVWCSSH